MATINVLNAVGGTEAIEKPLAPGRAAAAASRPVALSTEDLAALSAMKQDLLVAVGTTVTRPANTTAYAANDSISNNATAGSVVAGPVTIAIANDLPVELKRIRVATTDTGLANGISIRVWVYASDPTASTGVVGGDNAAYSNKKAGFVGTMTGQFRVGHSDGGFAICTPDEGESIIALPGTGSQTLWLQYQTLDAFTPSANSTTLIPTVEALQGA